MNRDHEDMNMTTDEILTEISRYQAIQKQCPPSSDNWRDASVAGARMRVLVACEFSGTVRDAFIRAGYDAWSCDLLPGEGMTLGQHYPELYPPGHKLHDFRQHHQCDVRDLFNGRAAHSMRLEGQGVEWDLMIAHPPCTYLSVSGLHWNKRDPERAKKTETALLFVRDLMDADIPKICIENPVSCISSRIRKPDQIIQPYMFGHDASKRTCLWLKGLPLLEVPPVRQWYPPRIVWNAHHTKMYERWGNQTDSGQNRLGPSADRWKIRSETYEGIARAMAKTWG